MYQQTLKNVEFEENKCLLKLPEHPKILLIRLRLSGSEFSLIN